MAVEQGARCLIRVILGVCWLMAGTAVFCAPLHIRYPERESSVDQRSSYPLAVLQVALAESDGVELIPSAVTMQQARSLLALEQGLIDVAWTVSTPAREERLRRVAIPIDRGLIGWRVLLIRQGEAQRFASVDGIERLRQFRAGLGHDWPDAEVLRGARIPVVTAAGYDSLFQMLALGRFDFFPRALSEVEQELEVRADMHLAVEPTLLLHYPAGLYFFVHQDNEALAERLEQGLREAISDGRLPTLFAQTFGATLDRMQLADRRLLTLEPDGLTVAPPGESPPQWLFEPES